MPQIVFQIWVQYKSPNLRLTYTQMIDTTEFVSHPCSWLWNKWKLSMYQNNPASYDAVKATNDIMCIKLNDREKLVYNEERSCRFLCLLKKKIMFWIADQVKRMLDKKCSEKEILWSKEITQDRSQSILDSFLLRYHYRKESYFCGF